MPSNNRQGMPRPRRRPALCRRSHPRRAQPPGFPAALGLPDGYDWWSSRPGPRLWGQVDYLLWQVKGDRLPPLVTTSPPGTPQGQAGVAGTPGVATLFGGSSVNNDWRSGGRVWLGYWFDPEQTLGVETSFFMLANAASGFAAGSGGTPILARPFFNAVTGKPDAELIAFPGIAAGTASARETSSLHGVGHWLRPNLFWGDGFRVDALVGYRYLSLTGRLGISEDLVSTNPASPTVPLGTRLTVFDQFYTANEFHGADLGLTGAFYRGPWILGWRATVALGANLGAVDIGGITTNTVPGFAPQAAPGGLLALASNSGHFERTRFAVVPQVGLKLGYQITPQLRAVVGYDFLYWTSVMRPGGQIDTTVNPNLLPPVITPLAGPMRPAPLLASTDVWVQGISLGLQFSY